MKQTGLLVFSLLFLCAPACGGLTTGSSTGGSTTSASGGSGGTTTGQGGGGAAQGGGGSGATTSAGGATTTSALIDCTGMADVCPNGQGCGCGGPGPTSKCTCGALCSTGGDCTDPAQPVCCMHPGAMGVCTDECTCNCK